MAGFTAIFVMAILLGAASFGTGMLPLSVAFSKSSLASLTAFGTGLLLGAALGVVIPEGVEAVVVSSEGSGHVPTTAIALSLIAGFTFMLVVERQFSSHGDSHMPLPTSDVQHSRQTDVSSVEFDVELGELEREEGFDQGQQPPSSRPPSHSGLEPHETRQRAYPLTLGLVVHALADGLALGSAALSESSGADASVGESIIPSGLSIVVFLALIIHKAPTALALTTSLLSTSLPVAECKKHLAIFSASTPIGTLVSYTLLSFFGASGRSHWPGIALLFSGGSFLYVATVLQPSLAHAHAAAEEVNGRTKMLLTLGGMLTPYAIALVLGGGHGH
ncbi:Zinc/iron permease [Earliella scabrosa]|nr:Zinc/iron permease [Earliella scabrosa]